MWNPPTVKQLAKLPALYATEKVELKDKKIYMHFFLAGSDWYIAEFDGHDTMFGYAILNGDTEMAEWGYISLAELKAIKLSFMQVDRDIHWTVKPASEIKNINC
jgi:hypothetical protein